MNDTWTKIALREILEPVSRPESVQIQKTYDILGAHWYAKGLYTKAVLAGSEIKASKIYRVEKNDFVYNRLFGWKGSFAVATEKNHNCYVSNEFPCFLINQERLDKRYLRYYFSRESAWLEALGLSSGGTPTSRNRLKQEKLLAIEIPLPPLEEQRRIVARIEELADKVEQAQSLRNTTHKQINGLLFGLIERITKNAGSRSMEDIAPLVRRPVEVMPMENYHQIGIYSFGRGVFHKPPVDGFSLGNKRIYKIAAGDLLFNNVFAWEGAIAVAGQRDDGRVGSHRFITCVPNTDRALAPFLCYYFLSRDGLEKIGLASPGSAGRNRTLNIKALMKIEVPLPSLEEQRHFCAVQTKVEAVKRHQATTAAKLDALLPSILDKAFKGEL